MSKLTLYFGCPLAGLPFTHRTKMIALRDTLKNHFEVLEFCPAETPPKEIYTHDIHHCVATADFMVAVCDKPSTGLGWEMTTMVEKHGKPVLALSADISKVSSLVQGVTNTCFELRSYSEVHDILALALEFAKKRFPEKMQ
jgi:hypothetical protein